MPPAVAPSAGRHAVLEGADTAGHAPGRAGGLSPARCHRGHAGSRRPGRNAPGGRLPAGDAGGGAGRIQRPRACARSFPAHGGESLPARVLRGRTGIDPDLRPGVPAVRRRAGRIRPDAGAGGHPDRRPAAKGRPEHPPSRGPAGPAAYDPGAPGRTDRKRPGLRDESPVPVAFLRECGSAPFRCGPVAGARGPRRNTGGLPGLCGGRKPDRAGRPALPGVGPRGPGKRDGPVPAEGP